ncbi:hypothetical protein MPTK1_2g20210 [Marchantia polymorpha subsp. ruderalis]|uniref:Uncharacterized protein n=1 Tax=Marchantia polymorpha TaxID=3197 RepID=A0A2R6WV71_MARPO|nr:hypothetical protein MARPO_0055s0028 [Marchantia polymorpha]BBN03036.1 hypothetical protein Mp_2g20210 [Marchantia polymorpha subsp. ruderalis]|eukprot:PTQ37749.1 hypothetical protein MARPO_0055s0028 [Marchantia polymorpha]
MLKSKLKGMPSKVGMPRCWIGVKRSLGISPLVTKRTKVSNLKVQSV